MTSRSSLLVALCLLFAAAPAAAQAPEDPGPGDSEQPADAQPDAEPSDAEPPDAERADEPAEPEEPGVGGASAAPVDEEPRIAVPVEPPPPRPTPTDGPPPPLREPADVEPPLTPTGDSGQANDPEADALGAALRQRQDVQPWHIAFGTATGLSTYLMTILGYLTYSDRYGFDGPPGCSAGGSPIFGRESCTEPPLAHLVAASTASTLFTTTFVLSLFMPDPLHSADQGGSHAALLTVHKSLRWALLVLFAGQLALGAVTSNIDTDFQTQHDLATAHLVIGTATMFTMTTQGVIGSFMEW